MAITSWPDLALLVSSTDPNDPATPDSYTDLTTRMMKVRQAARGRQYESDQNMTGRATIEWRNTDEYLNPANSSSPLLNNARPMRRVKLMGMYPRGGTGNLLNPQNTPTMDGSFEAYSVGAAPSWVVPYAAAAGVTITPSISSTTPFAGLRCLQWTTTGGTVGQGVSFDVQTIPGRQYTAQCRLKQAAAGTYRLEAAGVTGASTTTTGAYVLLSVTFAAAAIYTTVRVTSVAGSSITGGTVQVDNVQVEPGAAANTFTTSGPRIRGIWGGHFERVPVSWEPGTNGYAGRVVSPCVGPFAALAQLPMHTDLVEAVLVKAPRYYWPLWDGSQATAWSEVSGNNGPLLQPIVSPFGAGQGVSPGGGISIAGDPGGSGVQFTPGTPQSSTTQPGTIIGAGAVTRLSASAFAFPWAAGTVQATPTINATMMAYVQATQAAAPNDLQFIAKAFYLPPNMASQLSIGLVANTAGNARAEYYGPDGSVLLDSTTKILDGKPHLVVMTLNAVQLGNYTLVLYVDGVQVATSTGAVAGIGVSATAWNNIQMGGQTDGGTLFNLTQQGIVAHVALWNRVLSAAELSDLANAAKGYVGELSGTRIARYLAQNYAGSSVVDPGMSRMGPPSATEGSSLLPALQRITDSEAGNLFENRDGQPEFDDRQARYLRTVPRAVFGENVAGGEIPYLDGIVYGYDLAQVANQASVTQQGGVKAIAGPDVASQKAYFTRGYSQQVDLQSPYEVQDRAAWVVANRSQPEQRLQSITLDPGANPALWPQILDLEIGQRYTGTRRPQAANGGAGLTMTGDYFLEYINHRDVDPEQGTWKVDLILSPAPLQPWVLGDATWGQLGITTVLGF